MAKFIDLHEKKEDDRIHQIGTTAMKGLRVACCVDDEQSKIDRYIRKLLTAFPKLEIKERFKGPTEGVYTLIVVKKNDSDNRK